MLFSVFIVFIVCAVPFQGIKIYYLFTQGNQGYQVKYARNRMGNVSVASVPDLCILFTFIILFIMLMIILIKYLEMVMFGN